MNGLFVRIRLFLIVRWTTNDYEHLHLTFEKRTIECCFFHSLFTLENWLLCHVEKQYVRNRINRTFFLFVLFAFTLEMKSIWNQTKKNPFCFNFLIYKCKNHPKYGLYVMSSQSQCDVYKESEENKNINNQTTAGYWFKHINNCEVNCG